MSNRHESLTEFPVVIALPLLWGDEDAFGHVNNTVYLRWCEAARVEYLARIGLWQEQPGEGIGPILASISCNYRRPLNYPDTVHVGARVMGIGNSSFRMEHRIVSEAHGVLAADADSTLVVLDYDRNKAVPVPEPIRKAIEELEKKTFQPNGNGR